MKVSLTDGQREALEQEFGTHEELQGGEYYNLVAQVLTGEDEWTLEVGEVSGAQLSCLNDLVARILDGEITPLQLHRALNLLDRIDEFVDEIEPQG
jgi:hypothetical protein